MKKFLLLLLVPFLAAAQTTPVPNPNFSGTASGTLSGTLAGPLTLTGTTTTSTLNAFTLNIDSGALTIDSSGNIVTGGNLTAGLFYPTNTLLALDALGLDGNLYVWSHFALAASDERLYISCSKDGVNWFTLNGGNNVFAYPGYVAPGSFGSQSFGSVRDAAITYDGAQFVVVHTPLDSGTSSHSFRVLTSPDLIHWTHIYDVPCPSGTTSGSTGYGNPVWITDTSGTVHVMFCGSTTGTITNSNCYVWEIHPSVAGVYTAWSTPSAITSLQYTADNRGWSHF